MKNQKHKNPKHIFWPVHCIWKKEFDKYKDCRLYTADSLAPLRQTNNRPMLWNANTNRHIHTFNFVEEDIKLYNELDINPQVFKTDKDKYLKYYFKEVLDMTDYEKSSIKNIDFQEVKYFAKQKIENEYPEFLDRFVQLYPDERNVVAGIEKFITIVLNDIVKRQTDYPRDEFADKKIKTANAYRFLQDRGYTKLPGFQEAWILLTDLYQLPGKEILAFKKFS